MIRRIKVRQSHTILLTVFKAFIRHHKRCIVPENRIIWIAFLLFHEPYRGVAFFTAAYQGSVKPLVPWYLASAGIAITYRDTWLQMRKTFSTLWSVACIGHLAYVPTIVYWGCLLFASPNPPSTFKEGKVLLYFSVSGLCNAARAASRAIELMSARARGEDARARGGGPRRVMARGVGCRRGVPPRR